MRVYSVEPLVTFNPCRVTLEKETLHSEGDLHSWIYRPHRGADVNERLRVIDTILTIHDAVVGRAINSGYLDFLSSCYAYSVKTSPRLSLLNSCDRVQLREFIELGVQIWE